MKKAVTILLGLALFLFAASEGFLWYALRPSPHAIPSCAWQEQHLSDKSLRDTFVVSPDGTRLHARYLRAQQPTDMVAVLVHGYNDQSLWMSHIAAIYDSLFHCNIIMPDNHAHGLSEGSWIQMGWNDRLDVLMWSRIANDMFGGNTRQVLHGVSMGGATIMCVSGEELPPFIRCFVDDCGYTSVWDEFSDQLDDQFGLAEFPFLYLTSGLSKVQLGWSFSEASPLEQVKKCRRPMLFIHGDRDTYVRTSMVHELYQAKSGTKELWLVKGAEHAESAHKFPKEYGQHLNDFVGRHINQ